MTEQEVIDLYIKRFGRWFPDAIYRVKKACAMLGTQDLPHILDAAGFFPSAYIFTRLYPGSNVTIYNLYQDDILSEAQASIDYRHGDIGNIDYPDSYFDLVFMGEIIEHIYDIEQCLKEMRRVLRPGGMLVLTTPNLAAWYNRILLLCGRCPTSYHPAPLPYSKHDIDALRISNRTEYAIHHFHIRVFLLDRLLDYLKHAGFSIIRHDIISLTTPDKKFFRLRKLFDYILPKSCKDDIIVVAKKEI
jgi:SAM-dependent methyltransferase